MHVHCDSAIILTKISTYLRWNTNYVIIFSDDIKNDASSPIIIYY